MSAGAGSATMRQIPALSGIRALAAVGVLATHTGYVSGRSLRDGPVAAVLGRLDFGVALFFLLSGFLLFRPFARGLLAGSPMPAFHAYAAKRLVRIFPAAWLAIVVTLTALSTAQVRLADWYSYLLLVQTYDRHDYLPGLTQLWTLTTELAFYAALPLLALAMRGVRRRRRLPDPWLALLGGMVLAPIGYAALVFLGPINQPGAILWLPAYLDWFALGIGLALVAAAGDDRGLLGRVRRTCVDLAAGPGTCWTTAGLLFLLSALPLGTPRDLSPPTFWQWGMQHYLFGAAACLVLLPLVLGSPGRAHRILGSGVGRYGGDISYGFYLWHLPLLIAFHRWFGYRAFTGSFALLFTVTFVATAAISTLSWRLLERPLLRHLDERRASARSDRGSSAHAATMSTPTSTMD